jgi:AraC-like DNA-binding protein
MLLPNHLLRRLCLARDLLCDMQEQAPSVRDVARQLGFSPFHFIRQFEAVFGQTPHQYRTHVRLERAKVLLALHDLPVTEVCLEVGFSSLGSFSGLFTRRMGTSPSAYRRRLRTRVQVPAALPQLLQPGCLSLMGLLPPAAFRNFREAPRAALAVCRPGHPELEEPR